VDGTSTERLVNVCKAVGADTYLSGISGRDYLDEKLFEKNNIKLRYQNYEGIRYTQNLSKTFIPNLSIIDVLANTGPEINQFLKN
ncbi:WbqC-like family protein, partial [Marine Group I thaumarchaeote SCGC AAA799-B03]